MFSARALSAVACLIALAACATPVPPSGGPIDRTPPEIVSLEPESGSVNVEGRTIRIEFSEWVDQRSFETALIVTPQPAGDLSFRWRRRTVEITFPDALRPNTTYVLTIDTGFRDFGGTRLTAPITIAFSTGPTINRGRIAGHVVEPARGLPVSGIDVYAYAGTSSEAPPPDSLPPEPDYRTQTGDDGRFEFEYLSEAPFFVIALQDANRNRRADPGEMFAVPPTPWLVADTIGAEPDHPWVVTTLDSIAPSITRARPLSNTRVEIRYDEPISFLDRDPDGWNVRDSLSGAPVSISDVYRRESDPRSVFLIAQSPMPARPHVISTGAVADSSGNIARNLTTSFVPSAVADTVTLRFTGFVPDTTAAVDGIIELNGDQVPGVRFSTAISIEQLRNYVSASDATGGRTISEVVSEDGTTFGLRFDPPFAAGDTLTLQVDDPENPPSQTFRRLDASELGEISGVAIAPDAPDAIAVVELYEEDANERLRVVTADADGAFMFTGVPGGTYRLRLFADEDESRSWSGGQLRPFRAAEPLAWWSEDVTVRPRWETALPDTILIPAPVSPSTVATPSP